MWKEEAVTYFETGLVSLRERKDGKNIRIGNLQAEFRTGRF
jgi:hypothetical protein